MKTLTSGMTTHIGQTVTTLAMCWGITRVDGVQLYFTSHDRDLVVDGNTYLSAQGFNPTSVSNDSAMSVDNLDVVGVLDNAQITELDMRLGKYDYADVELFLVNWSDLTDGKIKVRKGRLGELSISPSGTFNAEIRGLMQQLQQAIVEVTTPSCRADLGDRRCKAPINPDLRIDSKAYSLGDFVRVNDTLVTPSPLTIINHSFESELGTTITGWTSFAGTPEVVDTRNGLSGFDGANYLEGDATGSYEARQDIDVTSYATPIDAGDIISFINVKRANSAATDTGRVIIEALDVSDVFISNVYDSADEAIAPLDVWADRGGDFLAVPVNTRKLRIRLSATLLSGTQANSAHDQVQISFAEKGVVTSFSDVFTNSDFEFGDDTAWTVNTGTLTTDTEHIGITPKTGSHFLRLANATSALDISQVLDINADTGIITADIDSGLYGADINYSLTTDVNTELDTLQVKFTALDALDAVVSTLYDVTTVATSIVTNGVWQDFSKSMPIPSGTRKIKIEIIGALVGGGTNINMAVDDLKVNLNKDHESISGYNIYSNRIYKCTTAGISDLTQPTFDTTVTNTTADGSAVWTANEAWTRHGEVATVTDNKEFTITLTETRAIDDWFNFGVLTWDSGDNAGRAMEVRDWVQTGSTLTLFLAMEFDIQVADKFHVHAGCDKRLSVCIAKFVNVTNFRGEPYVPGQDQIVKYPDAR